MSYFRDMRWTCHVCGDERPDAVISVFQRKHSEYIIENIRYCNDRKDCAAGAQTFSFLNDMKNKDL